MVVVQQQIDQILTLLRNKIRERGFTQLEVQEALAWGRSYISQLLTKQKSLRVEQVLLILNVIGVDPADFYAELYHFSSVDQRLRGFERYPDARFGAAPFNPSTVAEVGDVMPGDFDRSFHELRSLLRGLVRLLVDKGLINVDDLTSAVKACEASQAIDDFDVGKGPLN